MKTLYKNDHAILSIQGKDLFLHIKCWAKFNLQNPMKKGVIERTLQIDNEQKAIDVVKRLLGNNYKLLKDLTVIEAEGKRIGKLQHHLLAELSNKSLDEIRNAGVHFINSHDDLRSNNLQCSIIPPQETSLIDPSVENISLILTRDWDDIVIQYKPNGVKYRTDYSPELERVVMSGFLTWKSAARDHRLAACILGTSQIVYLYQIRIIQHLYGLPSEREDFIKVVQRFRNEYPGDKFNIDHLDTDVKNNRLNNLFLMPCKTNITKQSLTAKIKYPNFWHSKRYDDGIIRVQAGYGSVVVIDGKFALDEFITEMRRFIGEEALVEITLEECA